MHEFLLKLFFLNHNKLMVKVEIRCVKFKINAHSKLPHGGSAQTINRTPFYFGVANHTKFLVGAM